MIHHSPVTTMLEPRWASRITHHRTRYTDLTSQFSLFRSQISHLISLLSCSSASYCSPFSDIPSRFDRCALCGLRCDALWLWLPTIPQARGGLPLNGCGLYPGGPWRLAWTRYCGNGIISVHGGSWHGCHGRRAPLTAVCPAGSVLRNSE